MVLFNFPPRDYQIVDKKIWRKYLEMNKKPPMESVFLPKHLEIRRIEQPTSHFYKYIYAATGLDLDWVDRLLMPENELLAQISSETVHIFLFLKKNCPVGFAELDFNSEGQVELKYFGLIPEFRGRKWGKILLNWTIQQAWQAENLRRIHLSTCELDDARALPFYLAAGFSVFEEKMEWQRVLRKEHAG